jgi:hypothetical protein
MRLKEGEVYSYARYTNTESYIVFLALGVVNHHEHPVMVVAILDQNSSNYVDGELTAVWEDSCVDVDSSIL